MTKQEKREASSVGRARFKTPLNPSIMGTAKQAASDEKGGRIGSGRRHEGRGAPPGHGRGGKVSHSRS